ncbi:MAG TPA: HD domain-containing phosphohydrolase [Thermoanaerobaculia bacterium]|nr:HD domain-containing phosphohydrolase [Thermoanaerobaculia bacterium]
MLPKRLKRGPRLLWTLLAVLIGVSVLPLVVSHYFLIGINRDSLETLEKKYLTRSAVSIAAEVQNLAASYVQQLNKIATGVKISASLLGAGKDPFAYAAETNFIVNYTTTDNDILALSVVNRAGQGATAQPAGLGPEVQSELNRAFTVALSGQPYAGSFQYVAVLNQPAMIIAVPVADSTGAVIGAVEALVSLRRISDRIRDEGKAGVTAFLADRSGRVLIHSQPALSIQRPLVSHLRIVQEFMKAPVRLTQSYPDQQGGQKVELLGTVAPVGSPDWGVVVQKEQKQAFSSVRKMIRGTVQWGSLALLLAILVGTVFAHKLSEPIRILAARTRDIASGDHAARVEVTSRNEIGDLAENFNIMSDAIEQSMAQLKKAANENNVLFINAVRMLAAAIDAKDPYTRGHSERVARYSIAIGKHLELPPEQMRNLRISALLHDVGKIGIDDRILRKPGALSDDEFEVMKQHPEKGAAIMGGVAQLIDIMPGMRYHHEKWAGGGYPEGLVADQIPMQARIVAIADTFDAMTTNRPYQKAMDMKYVVEKIVSFGGNRFDPDVVEAFVRAVRSGDIHPEEQIRGAA